MCKGILMSFLLCLSVSAFSQEIRYEKTAVIGRDGTRAAVNGGAIKISYSGQFLTLTYLGGAPQYNTFKFQYHHSENNNNIYYQVATEITTGQKVLNESNVIVVSADKSLVNQLDLMQGIRQSTTIYERKDESYGTMAR